jgi:hypothetical protein
MEFVDAKILGVVFNCTSEHSGGYGRRYYNRYYRNRYYGKHYKRYYKPYGGNNAAAADKTAKK